MPQIATKRLYMRPYRKSEHHLMHALIADPRVTFWRKHPISVEETRAIFEKKLGLQEQGLGWWAVFLNDQVGPDGAPVFVGQVILQPLERSDEIEIGWHFVPEFWGNGYASEAARALLVHAFAQMELERVVALSLPENDRSIGVIHRLGLKEGPETIHAETPHRYFVCDFVSDHGQLGAQSARLNTALE